MPDTEPGLVRRVLCLVWGSIRTQPVLTIVLLCVTLWLGLGRLWSVGPMWHAQAEVHIGNAIDPQTGLMDDEISQVSAIDLRDLLTSQSTIDAVAGDGPWSNEADDSAVGMGGFRRLTRAGWMTLESIPARLAGWLGMSRSSLSEEGRTTARLSVRAEIDAATHRVVRLHLRASTPDLAEQSAKQLLELVRDSLLREAHRMSEARMAELLPMLASARSAQVLAATAVTDYRLEIGRHDPEITAAQIQERLTELRGLKAELETDLKEAETNQMDIEARLANVQLEQTSRVVIEENPRIRELNDDINQLEARYKADLAIKTPKHQDMMQLRLEIESKKRDLNSQELETVRERVREPSMEYVGLLERKAQNHRWLVTLAGRELGMVETESQLIEELSKETLAAERMAQLVGAHREATMKVTKLATEHDSLERRSESDLLFSHLAVVGRPRVADRLRPDEPRVAIHVGVTLALALLLAIGVPTLRTWVGGRVVTRWQIERISRHRPLEVIGHLPGPSLGRLESLRIGQRRLPG